jgi:hypothetical protein
VRTHLNVTFLPPRTLPFPCQDEGGTRDFHLPPNQSLSWPANAGHPVGFCTAPISAALRLCVRNWIHAEPQRRKEKNTAKLSPPNRRHLDGPPSRAMWGGGNGASNARKPPLLVLPKLRSSVRGLATVGLWAQFESWEFCTPPALRCQANCPEGRRII